MAPSLPSPCACVPHFSPHMESCPATLLPSLGAGSAPHFYRHWEWSLAPHFYPHVCVCVCVPPLEVGAPPLLSPWSLTPHLYLHESATHFNPRVDSRPSLLSPLGGGGCPSLLSPCGVCAPYGIAPLTHTGIPLLNINAFGRVSRAHNFVVARPPTLNVQGQRCMQPCTY